VCFIHFLVVAFREILACWAPAALGHRFPRAASMGSTACTIPVFFIELEGLDQSIPDQRTVGDPDVGTPA